MVSLWSVLLSCIVHSVRLKWRLSQIPNGRGIPPRAREDHESSLRVDVHYHNDGDIMNHIVNCDLQISQLLSYKLCCANVFLKFVANSSMDDFFGTLLRGKQFKWTCTYILSFSLTEMFFGWDELLQDESIHASTLVTSLRKNFEKECRDDA